MEFTVIKFDGREEDYIPEKIVQSVAAAGEGRLSGPELDEIAEHIFNVLYWRVDCFTVTTKFIYSVVYEIMVAYDFTEVAESYRGYFGNRYSEETTS